MDLIQTEFIRKLIQFQSRRVFQRYLLTYDQIELYISKINSSAILQTSNTPAPAPTSTSFSITATSNPSQHPCNTFCLHQPHKQYHTTQDLYKRFSSTFLSSNTSHQLKSTSFHNIPMKTGYKLAVGQNISIKFKTEKRETLMTQAVPIKSFDSEIIYDSEESAQMKRDEEQFLDQVLEKVMDEDSETRIKREFRTKPIAKKGHFYNEIVQIERENLFNDRKKRNNSKSGKWSGANRNNYYKAILKFSTEHPYYTVSWKYWKPEKFYPKMIEQINKNETYYKKDVIQTKSFDQRQRKEFFEKEPKSDMIDLALLKVKDMQNVDFEAREILTNYQAKLKEKSQHMKMLDELIIKNNQKKYELEDLYLRIMGLSAARTPSQECPNSVFYS